MHDPLTDTATVAKALSDPNRLRALAALSAGELCVCQLMELLGLVPSTVSKHMSILRNAGLVVGRKQGKWMYYSLPPRTQSGPMWNLLQWFLEGIDTSAIIAADRGRLKTLSC